MFFKKSLLSIPAACAAILLSSCASDVPVPDDPDARAWTPKIQSSYSGWQPPKEMPAGNPDYAAAFEKASGPVGTAAEPSYVDVEIVGPSPKACLIDGRAVSDQEAGGVLQDFVRNNANPVARITWKGPNYAKKGAAIGDFCTNIGFRTVELKELPEKELEIPAPASEKGKAAVSGKLKAEIDRSVPGTVYVVQKGDSLSRIARKHYHNGNLWYIIYSENKSLLQNANQLTPGTKLNLPALKVSGASK